MAIAAALELANYAESKGLGDEHIVPRMDEWEVFPEVAATVATKAIEQGVARLSKPRAELYESARVRIRQAREASQSLIEHGFIRLPPEETKRS